MLGLKQGSNDGKVLGFTLGYADVLKLGIYGGKHIGSLVGFSEVSRDRNIGGSFIGIYMGQENGALLGSSDGYENVFKLGIDEVTDMGVSVGYYEVVKYLNLGGSLVIISMVW